MLDRGVLGITFGVAVLGGQVEDLAPGLDEHALAGLHDLRARALLAAGAGAGTRIALLYPNGSDLVVGWLAAAQLQGYRMLGLVVIEMAGHIAREVGVDLRQLIYKDLQLSGATIVPPGTMARLVKLIERGAMPCRLAAWAMTVRIRLDTRMCVQTSL